MPEPRESPILFSAPMVRAILEGRKTQTRRLLRWKGPPEHPPTDKWCEANEPAWSHTGDPRHWIGCNTEGTTIFANCPHGDVGDRLWVKETFWQPTTRKRPYYRADEPDAAVKWTPSIYMPRSSSRIDLVITSVRAERIQQITEKDAKAEGVSAVEYYFDNKRLSSCRDSFQLTWAMLHGSESWTKNPWVWVIGFERVLLGAR